MVVSNDRPLENQHEVVSSQVKSQDYSIKDRQGDK